MLKSNKNSVTYILTQQKLIKNQKRFMFGVCKTVGEKNVVTGIQKLGECVFYKDFSTFVAATRNKEPFFLKPRPPLEYNSDLQGHVLPNIDYSGYNHSLLLNIEKTNISENTDYYRVTGSFTSSNSPLNGVVPKKVSTIKLSGEVATQYLHIYPFPYYIKKTDISIHRLHTRHLSSDPETATALDVIIQTQCETPNDVFLEINFPDVPVV